MTKVFFRDDDVGELSQPMRDVFELLIEEEVPCNFQVVPKFLDGAGAHYIVNAQRQHPGLVMLNQHGFRHEQMINGEQVWSEFDGHRAYAEQRKDIEEGHEILRSALGNAFDDSIFTPPCHKYDEATVEVLGELGFATLSAGVKVDPISSLYYMAGRMLGRVSLLGKRVSYHGSRTPGARLSEVSVCIDVDEAVDAVGNKVEKSVDDLWAEFERCRARLSVVGVMLHHGKCEGQRVDTLRAFIKRLKADAAVEFRTINELATEAS
jgi:hypothetical protein